VSGEAEGFQQDRLAFESIHSHRLRLAFIFSSGSFKTDGTGGDMGQRPLHEGDGEPIDSIADVSHGRDGGVDAIIVISTPTQHGSNTVAGRLRTIIKTQDY